MLTCFFSGEDKCPHARDVQPIVESLRSADGIILSSPVFVCDASGAMKALFDHLSYIWMPHRPMEEMFIKAAVVITTTAGLGAVTANRTMKKNLRYWGVKRIYGYGTAVAAYSWEDVKADKKVKIHKSFKKLAQKIFKAARDGKELRPRLFTRFMFTMTKKMQHGYPEGHRDREYWKLKGWLDGKRPF
jgi:multimeric flavodoxin WrbA